MKYYWVFLVLSVIVGSTAAWTMNYFEYAHRDAYFGEITYDGTVTADNVMEKLEEYHKTASAAKVEVQGETVYDFGAAAPGSEGKHAFVVKNIGTEPLELELGATTCKCTLGELQSDNLAPGETTEIELEWIVKTNATGFEQSAELRTNDPMQPAIRFVVRGMVIRDIEFVPKLISFGEVVSTKPFSFSTRMYSYFDQVIDPTKVVFGSEELNEYADVTIEPFEPSADDDLHKNAHQGFLITANVRPGLRQGPLKTNLEVKFVRTDELVEGVTEETARTDESELASQEEGNYYAVAECDGRITGPLTLLPTPQVRTTNSGGYVWNLGRIGPEGDLEHRALVALKGSEKDSTTLTIGETYPSGVFEAEFGDPIGRGEMRLFPLNLKLKPGDELVDLLGKNKEDFGWLWIESDNPNVTRLRVAIKVFLEPRP